MASSSWINKIDHGYTFCKNNAKHYTDKGESKRVPDYMLNSLLGKRAPHLQSYDLPEPKTVNPSTSCDLQF